MGFHVVSLIVGLLSVLLSPGSQPRTQGLGEGGDGRCWFTKAEERGRARCSG